MRSEQEDSGSGGEGGEEDEIGHLDLSYAKLIVYWLDANNRSGVVDFTKPHVKLSLRYVYPLFILLYAIVMVTGTIGNAGMLVVIGRRRRLYKDPTQVYLANLAFSDLVKAAIVLPLTLVGQLLQNWILGGFLCYFLPMMQSFLVHVTVLTHVVIAVDRYRLVVHPMKLRPPTCLCVLGTWVMSVCVVLPYALFIKFIDLAQVLHRDQFDGVGICWQNLERHIEEYIRAMFISLYCMPLAIIAFLNVKVSLELKTMHEDEEQNSATSSVFSSAVCSRRTSALTRPSSIHQMAPLTDDSGHLRLPQTDRLYAPSPLSLPQQQQQQQLSPMVMAQQGPGSASSSSGFGGSSVSSLLPAVTVGGMPSSHPSLRMKSLTFSEHISETRPYRSHSTASSVGPPPTRSVGGRGYRDGGRLVDDYESTTEINVAAEQRSQRYLITMVTLYAACWFPVNVLILATHFVYETDTNSGHIDVSYLIFTFFGFLSTCVNPVLFASWRMSNTTRERLRGYLRLSARSRANSMSGPVPLSVPPSCSHAAVPHSPSADFVSPTRRTQGRTYSSTHIRIGLESE